MKLDEPVTGGPCWTELGTGDLGAAKRFCTELFGRRPARVALARLLGRPGAPDLGFPHDFLREPVISPERNGTGAGPLGRDPQPAHDGPAGAVVPFPSASRSRPPRDDVS